MQSFVMRLGVMILVLASFALAGNDRKFIPYTGSNNAPLSRAVLVGDTLYIAGHIGTDVVTGKPGTTPEIEARQLMDSLKNTIEAAGFSMEDLVSVQIFCSNLDYVNPFNTVYRTYFHKDFPARAFIGSAKLLSNARFEAQGIAVRRHDRTPQSKK